MDTVEGTTVTNVEKLAKRTGSDKNLKIENLEEKILLEYNKINFDIATYNNVEPAVKCLPKNIELKSIENLIKNVIISEISKKQNLKIRILVALRESVKIIQ